LYCSNLIKLKADCLLREDLKAEDSYNKSQQEEKEEKKKRKYMFISYSRGKVPWKFS
jgi:hypothetical protein